jgi:hypothetical protein
VLSFFIASYFPPARLLAFRLASYAGCSMLNPVGWCDFRARSFNHRVIQLFHLMGDNNAIEMPGENRNDSPKNRLVIGISEKIPSKSQLGEETLSGASHRR